MFEIKGSKAKENFELGKPVVVVTSVLALGMMEVKDADWQVDQSPSDMDL